jgi:hypothetical protein
MCASTSPHRVPQNAHRLGITAASTLLIAARSDTWNWRFVKHPFITTFSWRDGSPASVEFGCFAGKPW